MEIINGNTSSFNELINSGTVLVDFYATWCGPCKMLSPVLETIKDKIQIIKIDIDQNMDLARSYGVMSVPTLIIFKKGMPYKTSTGFMAKEQLEEWLKEPRKKD